MLEIDISFSACYGSFIKEMEGADGEKALHLCLPINKNGIVLTDKNRLYWNLKVCGRFLIPTFHKDMRERLIKEGFISPEEKRPGSIVGVIKKFKN